MWKHVLYIRFFSTIISASDKVDQGESDVSLMRADPNPKAKFDSDVSYIDDRFIKPGEIEPQLLQFSFNKSAKDSEEIGYHWKTPSPDDRQRIDFHLDFRDSNRPHILELNLGTTKTAESRRSFQGRRNSNSSHRRSVNTNPLKLIRGNKQLVQEFLTSLNHPYMAAIIINGRLWCAGTIVDENWVLTAAHCLNFVLNPAPLRYLGDHVKVRVGSTKPHEGGQLHDAVGAVRHPKFEEEPPPHADIALLKLAVHLELTRHVNIIKIYEGVKEPLAQSFIVVAGWGATKSSDMAFREPTPDLTVGRMKVRSQTYCMDSYQLINDFEFTPEMFCASLRNGTRDACLFDAGAPAIQQNRLVGVMSFGPERCGLHAQPAVFIKAFYFRDFVKSTISAYKTTKELIEAMQEISVTVRTSSSTANKEGYQSPSFLLDIEPGL